MSTAAESLVSTPLKAVPAERAAGISVKLVTDCLPCFVGDPNRYPVRRGILQRAAAPVTLVEKSLHDNSNKIKREF
jgi:hypothetical protein